MRRGFLLSLIMTTLVGRLSVFRQMICALIVMRQGVHMQQVTREDVYELIQRLPDDKLVTLYDFGRYILQLGEVPDFLRATPSELAAEEVAWDEAFAQTDPAKLQAWVDKAMNEEPLMGIDASGDELKPTVLAVDSSNSQ